DLARLAHDLERRLVQRFRVELLNRFDQIVHFRPLSRADVRTIAGRELQSLKERIGFKRSGLELEIDEAVLDWLAVHGYDPRFGARFLRRGARKAEGIGRFQPRSGERFFRRSAAHAPDFVNHGLQPWLHSYGAPRLEPRPS